MARAVRSGRLETRTQRLRLKVQRKPYYATVAPGISLGYRRNKGAGAWVVRVADGHGSNWIKAFSTADDHEDSNGNSVLTYWEAQERARALARGTDANDAGRLLTVAGVIDAYEADLVIRGADPANARRVRRHLPSALLAKAAPLLTVADLKGWRDGLLTTARRRNGEPGPGLKPSAVNRLANILAAALENAAKADERITSRPWRVGLEAISHAKEARQHAILCDTDVQRVVAAAYQQTADFGLLVELCAVTGARISQIKRLKVGDLASDPAEPKLMMPSSKKGKVKKITRSPVPITLRLALALKQIAVGRPDNAPLLVKADGTVWREKEERDPINNVLAGLGLHHLDAKFYVLRHSSIVRQLLAGVPIRVVAVNHATGVKSIEENYSKYIGNVSDAVTRGALLHVSEPIADNVIPLAGAGHDESTSRL